MVSPVLLAILLMFPEFKYSIMPLMKIVTQTKSIQSKSIKLSILAYIYVYRGEMYQLWNDFSCGIVKCLARAALYRYAVFVSFYRLDKNFQK